LATNTLSGNAAQVAAFLKGHGLSDAQTAGILGNLQQENNFSTATNSGGLGMEQALGSRATALTQYANAHGLSPNSVEAQEQFLWTELEVPGSSSYQGNSTRDAFNATTTATDAATVFSQKFERPGNPQLQNRIQYANNFLPALSGVAGVSGSTSAGSGGGPGLLGQLNNGIKHIPIIGPVDNAVTGTYNAAVTTGQAVGNFFSWIGNPQNLLRVAYFVVGGVMVLIGGAKLVGGSAGGAIGGAAGVAAATGSVTGKAAKTTINTIKPGTGSHRAG